MVAFGDKAYLLLRKGGIPCGILGWQVENLVMKIDDVYLDENLPAENALSLLLKEAEDASQELNCELSLIIPAVEISRSRRTIYISGLFLAADPEILECVPGRRQPENHCLMRQLCFIKNCVKIEF